VRGQERAARGREQAKEARRVIPLLIFAAVWFAVFLVASEGSGLWGLIFGGASLVAAVLVLLAFAAGMVLIGGPGVALCLWVTR
jgi:predicted membrane-bound mannosyltransferase